MDKIRLKRLYKERRAAANNSSAQKTSEEVRRSSIVTSSLPPSPRISIATSSRQNDDLDETLDLYDLYGVKVKKRSDNVKGQSSSSQRILTVSPGTDPEELATLYRLETKSLPSNPDKLPDPRLLIEQAIANDLDSGIFTQEQFEVAENVIDWCRNPKFLGAKMDLFARQIQVLVHFFCDVCYHCSDLDFIHDVPVDATEGDCLDHFVLLRHGVCPQCKRNRTEILQEWQRDYRYSHYNPHLEESALSSLRPVPPVEFVGVWGQRSGKSFMVSTFAWTYILHRYLALPSMSRYFDQPDNAIFEASFVAPTLNQVKKYLWLPFRQAYFDSPWFREVREWTVAEGKRLGTPLYKSEETFIVFFNKRISIHVLAANSSTLRGGTRFFCLEGNSLVNTTKGLIPIKENLVGESVWMKGKAYKIVDQQEIGRKPVQKTLLENGYSINTTLDHRVKMLTPDFDEVWKEAQDLRIGDYVALSLGAEFPRELKLNYVPKKPVHRQLGAYCLMAEWKKFTAAQLFEETKLKGIYSLTHHLIKRGMLKKTKVSGQRYVLYEVTHKFDIGKITKEHRSHTFKNRDECTFPTKMTPELAYLLGYYVSEGSYAKNATEFVFSNTDKVVVDHFVSCFKSVFGFTPRVGLYDHENRKAYYKVAVAYKRVKKFLRYVGMNPSVAPTKSVPWSILQAPREAILAFLSAFIEGDGTISDKYVSMYSTSRKLIKHLQLLLLNLGVLSRVERRRREAPQRTLWSLRLKRHDSIKLLPQLTCPTKGKLFNLKVGKRFHNDYKLPYLPAFVDTSLHGGGVSKYVYAIKELNKDSYNNYALKRLRKENPKFYKKIRKLVGTGVVWMAVVKKKQLRSRPVFDITVDSEERAFAANGVVVHNCTVDELGWTSSSDGVMGRAGVRDGREVFQALSNSLRTFRTQAEEFRRIRLRDFNSLDGYMFNISSPSSISDPIMERAAQASMSPRIYYTHYATWEVNPREKEHLICEEFAGDPERLQRDFYAIPPRATSPFVDDDTHIEQLTYQDEDINLFEYETNIFEDDAGNKYLRPVISQLRADPHTPRVLAVDNGEVKNSFALILGRYYPEHDGVLYEECVEVAPYKGHIVDLAWCYDNFILPLVKSFNFLRIVYDRWNSAHAIHDLRTNHGMADSAIRYSLRRWKEFEAFRNDLYASKLWFSKAEVPYEEVLKQPKLYLRATYPRAHFRAQILTAEQFRKKVFKPHGGNDDLFRCGVLCHVAIQNNIKEYRSKTKRVNYGVINPDSIGFFSSRTGIRTQSSSGNRSRSSSSSGGGRSRRSFSYGGGSSSSSSGGGPPGHLTGL